MKVQSLRALYLEQLQDLFDAEHQLIRALPRMVKATSSDELRSALAEHLEKTRKQAQRIEMIFKQMGEKPQGQHFAGIVGPRRVAHREIADMVAEQLRNAFGDHLENTRRHVQRIETIFEQMGAWAQGKSNATSGPVKENREATTENGWNGVKDATLIATAQRVGHYKIAGYGCVRTYAEILGDKNGAALLAQTLDEQKATEEALHGIAARLNLEVPKRPCQSEKLTASRLARPGAFLSQLQY